MSRGRGTLARRKGDENVSDDRTALCLGSGFLGLLRLLAWPLVTLGLGVLVGCSGTASKPAPTGPTVSGAPLPSSRAPVPTVSGTPLPAPRAPAPEPLSQVFESEDYVVTFAGGGETAEQLAVRFLGDVRRAWMIEDYNKTETFTAGQEIVIPKHPWNPSGVEPAGYQVVPVLTYYNLAPQAKGRLVMALATFEAQMRYLKEHGYRVVRLRDLLGASTLDRQLPLRAVVLTFNDGWRSFREYAAPILKGLRFPATVFIYSDFVGAGGALGWDDLRALDADGFDIEVESKTHGDLRIRRGESAEDYARRLDGELTQPLTLVKQRVGTAARVLAYPYGAHNEDVERAVKAHGYAAAFDVRRQANPTFAPPFALHRAQVYADMSLDEFAKNLEVFNETSGP